VRTTCCAGCWAVRGKQVAGPQLQEVRTGVLKANGSRHVVLRERDEERKSKPRFYDSVKLNSVACSPQANYIDRSTAACRRS
jgi:hypothetical protein